MGSQTELQLEAVKQKVRSKVCENMVHVDLSCTFVAFVELTKIRSTLPFAVQRPCEIHRIHYVSTFSKVVSVKIFI